MGTAIYVALTFILDFVTSGYWQNDPILRAYRRAESRREEELGDLLLKNEMKNTGVPGIYSEPLPVEVELAISCWLERKTYRQFRKILRESRHG